MADTYNRNYPRQSMVLETNMGGVPATVCACGVVLVCCLEAWNHIDTCPTALAHGQPEGAT